MLELFFVAAFIAGEIIKFPKFSNQGLVLLDVLVIILCLFGIYKVRFRFKSLSPSLKFFLLFIIIALLSLLFTPLHLTLNEYLISFSYTLRLGFYLLLVYLIYFDAFGNFKKKITPILYFSGIGLAILGLMQFAIFPNLEFLIPSGWDPHYFRTVSTFLDPNFAGAYFVLTMLILYQKFDASKKWDKIIFLTVFLSLLTTFSRSSYIMFLISGIIFSIFKKSKKVFITTIILFIILVIGFYFYTNLVAYPRGIDREQSASYRINAWKDGLSVFQKSPFLGVGFNAYRYAIREYGLAGQQFLDSRGSSTNDSSLLYVLATTGIIGLVVYILFLFSILHSSFKKNYLLTSALIGLIIHSFFANSLFFPFILMWILFKVIDTKD